MPQFENKHTVWRTLARSHTWAGYLGIMFYLGKILYLFFYLVHDTSGFFDRVSRCSNHIDISGAYIFLWNKSGFGRIHQHSQQYDKTSQWRPTQPAVLDKKHDTGLISRLQMAERSLECHTEPFGEPFSDFSVWLGAHNERTQCRTKCQCIDSRNTYRHRHSHTELCIECTTRAAHKRYGNEYRHKYQCTGKNCRCNFTHGIYRGQIGRFITDVKFCLDSLYHNNGIIYDHANSQYEGKKS